MRIGFSFNHSNGGPATFMNNLKDSWERQGLVKTSYYFNLLNDCNIFASVAKLRWLKPFFLRIDGVNYDLLADPLVKARINEKMLIGAKMAKGVIFQSHFSKILFEEILGYKPSNQIIIHNGSNLDVFKKSDGQSIRHSLNIPNNSFVFVTSAKWRVHKRLKYIIDSFVDFKKRHPECRPYLLVIGETEDLNIEDVIFLQRIDNNKLPIYFSAADVYLFYSWLDNCPNSVVEAILCGLPTICTNQGGTHELVEKSHGGIVVDADEKFLFKEVELYNPPIPNMQRIATAMDEMYSNYHRYARRIQRGVFDIDYVSREYYDFIINNL